MSMRIAERFLRLERIDRFLCGLIGIWIVIGIPANYFRAHRPIQWLLVAIFLLWLATMVCIWAGIIYSIATGRRSLGDYGFSFRWGGLLSLAVIVAIHVYLLIGGKLELAKNPDFIWSTFGAFMEEVGFRAIAINCFAKLMEGTHEKGFWAVLGSTVLFCLPHLTSKTLLGLQGIFFSSLIMGTVYYLSRSILVPTWIHAASNAGFLGGMLATAACCLLGAANCIMGIRNRRQ